MDLTRSDPSNNKASGNDRWDATEKMISLEQRDSPIAMDVRDSMDDKKSMDGVTDFVLAYVDNGNLNHQHKREEFETELKDQGLELEYEQTGQLFFVKIHVPQARINFYIYQTNNMKYYY